MLNVPANWLDDVTTDPFYHNLMRLLHGRDIWEDEKLLSLLETLGIVGETSDIFESLLPSDVKTFLDEHKPKIFMEVGVYKGTMTTIVTKYFKENKGFEDSCVISIDTWLLAFTFE